MKNYGFFHDNDNRQCTKNAASEVTLSLSSFWYFSSIDSFPLEFHL